MFFYIKLPRYAAVQPSLRSTTWGRPADSDVMHWNYPHSAFLIHTGKRRNRASLLLKATAGRTASGVAGSGAPNHFTCNLPSPLTAAPFSSGPSPPGAEVALRTQSRHSAFAEALAGQGASPLTPSPRLDRVSLPGRLTPRPVLKSITVTANLISWAPATCPTPDPKIYGKFPENKARLLPRGGRGLPAGGGESHRTWLQT